MKSKRCALHALVPGRLARPAAILVGCALLGATEAARAACELPKLITAVDVDDDDGDGIADNLTSTVSDVARSSLPALKGKLGGTPLGSSKGAGKVRFLADGVVLAMGATVPERTRQVVIQGVAPGSLEMQMGGGCVDVGVLSVVPLDGAGRPVDWTRSNASIERTPPASSLDARPLPDPDALRFLLSGALTDLPRELRLESTTAEGGKLDALEEVPLRETQCPKGTPRELSCRTTPFIRAVADDIDRNHPMVQARSMRAEVGGALSVFAGKQRLQSLRVGGPRESPVGPISRLRGKMRVLLVRDRAHGAPPFGEDDAAALALARKQVALSNAMWGQCGVHFGPLAEEEVRLVDPPSPHMLTLGCDMGLPSSGGEIRLRADGREVRVALRAGLTTREAARLAARALERNGFVVRISENAKIDPGAAPSVDVLVRRPGGHLASLSSLPDGRLSTDPTLSACIGEVDLSDGLDHFTDVDAPAGTLEERTLVKAFDDADPRTIEVFMVPAFSGNGRIGESFIGADRSSMRNVVIEDRGGIRADRASFALAHELGHVLLDMPGHPDDFGRDTSSLLMDSDAADPSAFGPRRLSLEECARVVRQTGPQSLSPILLSWPLTSRQGALIER